MSSDLRRQLEQEVVVSSEGAQVHTLPHGGRERLDLVKAAVQLVQSRESVRGDDRKITLTHN